MVLDVTKCHLVVGVDVDVDESTIDHVDIRSLDGKTEAEPIVDADLDRFAKFYAEELANGSLSKFERAAIKTYLAWKLRVVSSK